MPRLIGAAQSVVNDPETITTFRAVEVEQEVQVKLVELQQVHQHQEHRE